MVVEVTRQAVVVRSAPCVSGEEELPSLNGTVWWVTVEGCGGVAPQYVGEATPRV